MVDVVNGVGAPGAVRQLQTIPVPCMYLSGSGFPIDSFFEPSNWWRAIGQRDRVLVIASVCHACGLPNENTADNHTCLSEISVDSVYARLAKDELI